MATRWGQIWGAASVALFGVIGWLIVSTVPRVTPPPVRVQRYIATAEPLTPQDQLKTFHLPPGFEIELFAAEPDIGKPINIQFDAQGRLWVTQSAEYPFPAEEDRGRDEITILEDTDGDGQADRFLPFAQGLNVPIGILPVHGGAIGYSIPYLYFFEDRDGDGRAEGKKRLYGPFEHEDTHGMVSNFQRGFDGWVYALHGFVNTSTIRGSDGSEITMTSGNCFRLRPDGSRVELFTTGQVNPFGMALDPLGNLFTSDCESKPLYQVLRGADYPHFTKQPTGIGFGPEMVFHSHGSSAVAGLASYAAVDFPPEFQDNLFTGNVITNRINRDSLDRHGSTLLAVEQPDFLVSEDPWFRPVNIQLGPDGALYVADFYNRIIGHYEVPLDHPGRDRHRGRIWRITYRDAPHQRAPNLAAASVEELVEALGDSNLRVRMLATEQLVDRMAPRAVEPLRKLLTNGEASVFQRVQGLWALFRLNALNSELLMAAASDPASLVRVHAMRVLSEHQEVGNRERQVVMAGLQDEDAFVQREAAQALRLHPAFENIQPLLSLRARVPTEDTHLLHVARLALRDQLRQNSILSGINEASWSEAGQHFLADAMAGVDSPLGGRFLLRHLQAAQEGTGELAEHVRHAARLLPTAERHALVEFCRQARSEIERQVALWQAFRNGVGEAGSSLSPAARRWASELVERLLPSADQEHLRVGFELAGLLEWERATPRLIQAVGSPELDVQTRVAAAEALVKMSPGEHASLLGSILRDGNEELPLKVQILAALGRIDAPEVRSELLETIVVAPRRLQVVAATTLMKTASGLEDLLRAVEEGKVAAALLLERGVRVALEALNKPSIHQSVERLTQGIEPVDVAIQQLVEERRQAFDPATADAARGAALLEEHCMRCHQLNDQGKSIGPKLDGVGSRGLDRLVEDILDPSRNVDPNFKTTIVGLKHGPIIIGLLLRKEDGVAVFADDRGEEIRVNLSDVQEQRYSKLSAMPGDFAEQLSAAQFNDLLAFLVSQRQ